MIVIYLGDVGSYLADLARATDNSATLLTVENCNELTSGTYYTSIADLENLQNLSLVLRSADRIVYAPPPNNLWSDTKKNHSQMQTWTEDYLKIFRFRTVVENLSVFDPIKKLKMLSLADTRKTDSTQLWIAGCSVSHGSGVQEHERFGKILQQKLNLPMSSLATPGSSIVWAADQILRSDIQENDIVVWGLTSTPRLPWFNNGVIEHILPYTYVKAPGLGRNLTLDYFEGEDVVYRSVVAVYQVINYCQKIGARLILASLLDDQIVQYLDNNCEFIMLCLGPKHNRSYLDLGSDNLHPGPLTHEFYATEILKKIHSVVLPNSL
jgi:hypothetical protein